MSDALTDIARDEERAQKERELFELIVDGYNSQSLHHENYHKMILEKAKECDSISRGYFSGKTDHSKNFIDFLRGAGFILEHLKELVGDGNEIPATPTAMYEFIRKKVKYFKERS